MSDEEKDIQEHLKVGIDWSATNSNKAICRDEWSVNLNTVVIRKTQTEMIARAADGLGRAAVRQF